MTRLLAIVCLILCGCSATSPLPPKTMTPEKSAAITQTNLVAKARLTPMPQAQIASVTTHQPHGYEVISNGCTWVIFTNPPAPMAGPYCPVPPVTTMTLAWSYNTNDTSLPMNAVFYIQSSTDLKNWVNDILIDYHTTLMPVSVTNGQRKFWRLARTQ